MSPSGDTILVVDDDSDFRHALTMLLRLEGYLVIPAEDGQVALNLLDVGARPSVILLDLMMPRLNGFDFLARTRQSLQHANIPVIVVSANQGYDAVDLGVFAIVRKPAEADDLLSAIERAAA
jgi:CheY-like chemotaxis protein